MENLIILNIIMSLLNAVAFMYCYSVGSYKVAIFNSFVSGGCLTCALMAINVN